MANRRKESNAETRRQARQQKLAQWLFAAIAILVILSMVVSAFANY